QRAEHVLGDGATADDRHLIHLGDHGKTFSMTVVTTLSRFAPALASSAPAASLAALTTLWRTFSSSLRPASASDCASASALARAASIRALASAVALSTMDLALALASSTLATRLFSCARRSCSRRSPCASKRPSFLHLRTVPGTRFAD